jgi:hypothetical protein
MDANTSVPLTISRALTIVHHAENAFGHVEFEDAFTPFREGGATSRDEARNALLIVLAHYVEFTSTHLDALENLNAYTQTSRNMSYRILCDGMKLGTEKLERRDSCNQEYDAFVNHLSSLSPFESHYWPSVYQYLGLTFAPDAPAPASKTCNQDIGKAASMKQQNSLVLALRWVAFIPAAALGAWLAWIFWSLASLGFRPTNHRFLTSQFGASSEAYLWGLPSYTAGPTSRPLIEKLFHLF